MSSRWVALAVACLALAGARTASAQDASACIAAFEDGQRLAASGKLLGARERLDVCGAPRCPGPIRADCTKKREEVERSLPTIAVILRDAEGRDVDAVLTLDGFAFPAQPGRAVPVDPGKHTLAYARPGRAPREHRFTATEGEKSRLVAITSSGDEPLAEASPAVPAPSSQSTPATEPSGTASGAAPWLVVAGGGVLLVAGGIFIGVGAAELSRASSIEEENRALPKDAPDAQFEALDAEFTAKRRAGKRNIAIGVTGMALGTATVVIGFIWRSYAQRQTRIAPVVTPSFGGLSLIAVF